MSNKDILTDIIIPLIAGFFGGGIGNIVIEKLKFNRKTIMKNNNTTFNNNGDVVNGEKR